MGNITFLMTAVFDPLPLTLDKLQFLVFIFALLLPNLCNMSILHHHTKFFEDRSNCCWDGAIVVIFKMAAATILDFQKFQILAVGWLYIVASMHHRAKFHQDQLNRCRDMAILQFFKMAATWHLRFVGSILGPSTMTWNRCRSFNNVKLSIFCQFGSKAWKHLFTSPKLGFGGYISPVCREVSCKWICTQFGTAIGVADIITCDNFSDD